MSEHAPVPASKKCFLEPVPYRKLDGREELPGVHGHKVMDYRSWAHSDILENVQRGTYAEFLVAAALGLTGSRHEGWAGYDLSYDDYKIEVKSKLSFGIGPKRQLTAEGILEADPRFSADCFVFCVFSDTDPLVANALDSRRWYFYVVPISQLIEFCNLAKTVVESRVSQMTSAVLYDELKNRIDATRSGSVFPSTTKPQASVSPHVEGKILTYVVWERGTRQHPVIVH